MPSVRGPARLWARPPVSANLVVTMLGRGLRPVLPTRLWADAYPLGSWQVLSCLSTQESPDFNPIYTVKDGPIQSTDGVTRATGGTTSPDLGSTGSELLSVPSICATVRGTEDVWVSVCLHLLTKLIFYVLHL